MPLSIILYLIFCLIPVFILWRNVRISIITKNRNKYKEYFPLALVGTLLFPLAGLCFIAIVIVLLGAYIADTLENHINNKTKNW